MPFQHIRISNNKVIYTDRPKHKEIKDGERCNIVAWNALYRIKLYADDSFDIIESVIEEQKLSEDVDYILYYEI